MAVDWVVNLSCTPKEKLGRGDCDKGTEQLLNRLKAHNQAEMIAMICKQSGESPDDKSISVGVIQADGKMKEREVKYSDLVAKGRTLDPLAPACEKCPANVLKEPFGCTGAVNYPIPKAVEQWLASRIQISPGVGAMLFLAAIQDLGFDGKATRQMRAAGLFESPMAIKKKLAGGFLFGKSVTTDQLFDAILFSGQVLPPSHCFGTLLWLGCLKLDGVVVSTPQQAQEMAVFSDSETRRKRTKFESGANQSIQGADAFESLLRAMYRSWVLDTTLCISA